MNNFWFQLGSEKARLQFLGSRMYLEVGRQHVTELVHRVHGDEDGQRAVDRQVAAFKHEESLACDAVR